MIFTEHGVLMLSSVLSSERAISVNIYIMRIFTKTHHLLANNPIYQAISDKIKRKTDNYTKNIEVVF